MINKLPLPDSLLGIQHLSKGKIRYPLPIFLFLYKYNKIMMNFKNIVGIAIILHAAGIFCLNKQLGK